MMHPYLTLTVSSAGVVFCFVLFCFVQVLFKWCQDWDVRGNPPNLIQTMISMFLSPGSVDPDKQLYEGQAGFQAFLLLAAFFSVPAMLLGKPYLGKRARESEAMQRTLLSGNQADGGVFSSPIVADSFDEHKAADPFGEQGGDHSAVVADGHAAHEVHDFTDEVRGMRNATGCRPLRMPWSCCSVAPMANLHARARAIRVSARGFRRLLALGQISYSVTMCSHLNCLNLV